MKKWNFIFGAALIFFAALQLFTPAHTNPPVKNDFITATKPAGAITDSLRAACYDCHSHETVWPFYARIAPVSWLVASDVNEGREHLNFSDWPTEADQAAKKLDRINEVLDYGEMPPKKYTLIHADARLSEAQRKEIMDWTTTFAQKLHAGPPSQ
ncbi:MAG: heme-binding domain-containing protein [Verrucomicrobiota bacterium]